MTVQNIKIKITGDLVVLTGLHIGASSAFAAIGATDSPVIKDPVTNLPVIPGSSLKGKMRTLLAEAYNDTVTSYDGDVERIVRIFGRGASSKDENAIAGRLLFRDMVLSNFDELKEKGAQTATEIKFENSIDRRTAVANPRQIERIIPGSLFELELIYSPIDNASISEDLETIVTGLKLLELDYLGGSGSRGYGRVKFENLDAEVVFGEMESKQLETFKAALSSVGE
ncbi:type III-A CRISPR-associated RAMP protein Csm3 [Tuanshanicoccus lijuaniae]|uniref:type III-A CRISPR-associated RAMP protein Csm3 n=1 Tax=Aerococcaceae bacterium zg-1292 TaxID=2774330 RepID=UPI001BD82038|nr:type III-A CRISPR-associated RAMP protein Csm3 [Aerococcaceae bacterium zg-A91]MBS4458503.1 type III-A CRISPR-associated RAMP protein Csm3 [Aerococcaceae bacterium zg-BR33]